MGPQAPPGGTRVSLRLSFLLALPISGSRWGLFNITLGLGTFLLLEGRSMIFTHEAVFNTFIASSCVALFHLPLVSSISEIASSTMQNFSIEDVTITQLPLVSSVSECYACNWLPELCLPPLA